MNRAPIEFPLRLSDPNTMITHPSWVEFYQKLNDTLAQVQAILDAAGTVGLPIPSDDGQIYVIRNGKYEVLHIS